MGTHSKCKRFSDSIDPVTIPKSNKEIKQLIECLTKDSILYLSSVKNCDSFVFHFNESILPKLQENKLSENFLEQIRKYATAELTKTTFVASNLEKILSKTMEDIEWWMEKYSKEKRVRRGEPEKIAEQDTLIDIAKIAYGDFVHLSVLLSQMFFALEYSSKMLCAFGCYRFALKISKSEVIQHKEVWKQLKKLGQKKRYDCEACVAKATCNFKIDFSALARIYAYSMKVRQVVDYTTRLASLNIFKSGLLEPPFVYFSSLIQIVENNFLLGKKCLPERYLRQIAHPFLIFEKGRKELYAPFSWSESELTRLTEKQPEDALAWYLLGKLYNKRGDTFEAIKCLEKAKKFNPKNPDIWHMLGKLYDTTAKTMRDGRKALKHLEEAKRLDPDNVDILTNVGLIHLSFVNTSKALENLIEAERLATDLADVWIISYSLSVAYDQLGHPSKSEKWLEKAKELDLRLHMSAKQLLDGFFKRRGKFRRYLKRVGRKSGQARAHIITHLLNYIGTFSPQYLKLAVESAKS